MNKAKYKLCNFNIPIELYDYLKEKSNDEFMSMTQFVIKLIKESKLNDNIKK
jgi:hypothetical protein